MDLTTIPYRQFHYQLCACPISSPKSLNLEKTMTSNQISPSLWTNSCVGSTGFKHHYRISKRCWIFLFYFCFYFLLLFNCHLKRLIFCLNLTVFTTRCLQSWSLYISKVNNCWLWHGWSILSLTTKQTILALLNKLSERPTIPKVNDPCEILG